jgi:NTE family protein
MFTMKGDSGLPRIGLVLGAGGVLGGAWMAGGLAALTRETGWDPGQADYIVGTSAGSLFAALLAADVPAKRLLPASNGAVPDQLSPDAWLLMDLAVESAYKVQLAVPRSIPMPGSIGLSLSGLRRGESWPLLRALGGLMPRGSVSTDPISRTVRKVAEHGWPGHPNCWITACDYGTGRQVVFGREGAPEADLADAVAASCAIPGYFEPVQIGDRWYVDGGVHSMSNAALLEEEGLDLVLVFNPLSGRAGMKGWNPLDRVESAIRRAAARQLDVEVARLLDAGTHVVVIEPTADDLIAIGHNLMNARRCMRVLEVALKSTTRQLRSPGVRGLLGLLPGDRRQTRRARQLANLFRNAGFAAAAAV